MCLPNCFEKFPYLKEYDIYIDVNNIVRYRFGKEKKAVLNDLILLVNQLIEIHGFKRKNIHCICDPSLRYNIDKKTEFKTLIKEGLINEAPKIADEFILSYAQMHEFCFIISNDKFREYIPQLPSKQWLDDRRISIMFIGEEVCLSPNIEYDRIDLLPLDYNENKNFIDVIQEKTTTDILNDIEKTEGEFNLF